MTDATKALFSVPDLSTDEIAHLDFCGALSCDLPCDPEFPSLVCTLSLGHEGMHHQHGVPCRWSRPEEVAERGW